MVLNRDFPGILDYHIGIPLGTWEDFPKRTPLVWTVFVEFQQALNAPFAKGTSACGSCGFPGVHA